MMKALSVLCLILCGTVATSFYEVTDSQLNTTVYQEESPFDDWFYKEGHQDEQESNTAAVQYNSRGDFHVITTSTAQD